MILKNKITIETNRLEKPLHLSILLNDGEKSNPLIKDYKIKSNKIKEKENKKYKDLSLADFF